jgi:UDP-N-acetylglucosamine:LPS N-acetylglucosamine transferase
MRVCIMGLGGGGFQSEVEVALKSLSDDAELILIYGGPNGGILRWASTKKNIVAAYKVRSPALMGDSPITKVKLFFHNLWAAIRILREENVDLVLAVGTVQFIPFAIAARILGRESWYIETITRVSRPSQTGRIVHKLHLATKLFYYWDELAPFYKNGTSLKVQL